MLSLLNNQKKYSNGVPAARRYTWCLVITLIVAMWAYVIHAELPNIIFIMADDLGYADIGAFGQVEIQTPNLDKMAEEGMKLTQFYSGTPVCGPARCNLMTGMHNGHCRIRNNGQYNNLLDEDITIAEVLKFAGYKTGGFGKWGLGQSDSTGNPLLQGYDHFFGYLDQTHAHNFYTTYLVDDNDTAWLANVNPNQGARGQGDAPADGEKEYSHTAIADQALQFIDDNKDTSFFMYVPFTIPHLNNEGAGAADGGYEVPGPGIYADRANWTLPMKSIAAMITLMDADIGRIFTKLKEHGIDGTTIVFFTSDNGPTFLKIGPQQLPDGTPLSETDRIVAEWFDSNGIYRGYKQDTFEGGIRMPMIVRWPGVIEPGTESEQIGYFPDVMPTLAALAGVSSPTGIDGLSMVPTLLGDTGRQEQHEYLFWRLGQDKAVLKGDWKLVVERVDGGDPQTFLFNIENDPSETTDLSAQNPDIVAELSAVLIQEDGARLVADWTPQVLTPAVIKGCMDSTYLEYDEQANVHDADACLTSGLPGAIGPGPGIRIDTIRLTVSFTGPGRHRLSVYGAGGQEIYGRQGRGAAFYDPGRELMPGVYTLVMEGNHGRTIARVLKLDRN